MKGLNLQTLGAELMQKDAEISRLTDERDNWKKAFEQQAEKKRALRASLASATPVIDRARCLIRDYDDPAMLGCGGRVNDLRAALTTYDSGNTTKGEVKDG